MSGLKKVELFQAMNYLNIQEYQGFCDKHKIPYHIYIEQDGKLRKTSDKDRKDVVLARIKKFVTYGKLAKPTVYSKQVVSSEELTRFSPSVKLHYGQYDKKNPEFISFLKSLTDGQFKNGAKARIVLRDFWTRGKAPTLKEFARAWMKSTDGYLENHPEAAYLTDRRANGPDANWKALRVKKAKSVLAVLNKI
jgi:hypothetical protein